MALESTLEWHDGVARPDGPHRGGARSYRRRHYTGLTLRRAVDGVEQSVSVHGDRCVGYVLSAHENDEAKQDVRERFLLVREDATGEVELAVDGCATPFAARWVGRRDDVLGVLLAFLCAPLAEVRARWEQTLQHLDR
jgi:hypothetical protein